ncbi:MAG: hypothetical protein BME94_04620 [Methanobacteriales archaeon Met13]
MYKVIFHLDEAEDYRINLTLNNINNVLADLEEVEVELVVYAQGIRLYFPEDNPYLERVADLKNSGVKLAVCNNTLQGMMLKTDDLVDGVETVSSGVGELVRKQAEGWIYIRP